ncbi:glutathione S-transferase N-terminal domain-containing protein [Psychrobacter sp.]|uniref:glutathione S-transferase N-terminal domain-containing protein n=1 Tax=Psychrobacter sp. TaxID=56811 RepID=UPI0025F55814|nr:glutathione S-transferase N-terminal domain-containing protein [Psychrobacter sp.]
MIVANNKVVHQIKSSQSLLSTLMRGGLSMMGTSHPMQPEKPLILYEFEACPFCRRVREAMTHLNLDYESRPSPKQGQIYRNELQAKLAEMKIDKIQVPFLIDQNTGESLPESQDIIDYLFKHYSKQGRTPKLFQPNRLQKGGVGIFNTGASLVSMMRGVKAIHPKKNEARGRPEQLIELYGFEASPFCRLVRETLCQLEISYINHYVAREQIQDIGTSKTHLSIGKYKPVKGGKRERIMDEVMNGKIQVPYLIDPNTGTKIFESKDIIEYLNKTYG